MLAVMLFSDQSKIFIRGTIGFMVNETLFFRIRTMDELVE